MGAGAADIDYVLIGPAGVFTFNTKNHSGQAVWVGERAVQVARITAAAVLPWTWHKDPAPPEAEPAALPGRCADLRASVPRARRRRELWRLGGLLAVLALVFGPDLAGAVLNGLSAQALSAATGCPAGPLGSATLPIASEHGSATKKEQVPLRRRAAGP